MKKYLLTLCLTMLGFVASWAQWAIDVSTAPVYVEVNDHSGSAHIREFTITTPENAPAYTVEVKEKPLAGATAGTIAKVSTTNSGNTYTATFSAATKGSSVGITRYYIQIKVGDEVVSSTEAEPFEVNVYDETKARFITNPGDQYITKNDTKFVVEFAPATAAAGATITATQGTGNKGTISVGNTFTVENQQKNLVSFTLSCNAQVEVGDKVTITIAPPAGSKDRNGKDVPSVTFTLTVNLPELPVEGVTTEFHQFKVGYEFSSPLSLPSAFVEGEDKDYTVKYTYIPVAGYRNDVVSITPNDKQTALLRTEHAGMAYVKATFTPHGTTAQSYRAWERILTVVASPTQMKLASLTYETTGTGTGATYDVKFNKAADDPEVTFDPELAAGVTPEYEITYSLEGALPSTAHLTDKSGYLKSVVIDNGDPSQVFYLVATLTPTGANASDYLSDVVRVPILVHGSGNTGAFLEKQSDGSWVAYLDQPSSTDKNIVATFTVKKGTLDEFKAATDIKVMGSINSFNIAQLVHAMGADQQATEDDINNAGGFKTVDMSGCVMVGPLEFSHTKAGESDPVEDFKFPITGVAVGDDNTRVGKSLTLKNVANFTFPKPDPNYTTLPSDVSAFFGNQYNPADNNLTSLTIPEGWTEVPDGFSGKISTNRWRTSAFSKLVNLKLANTIEKIGPYAFADLKAVVLTMPYNIDRIGKSAFSTSLKLQDVYFTGPAPRYVDTQAFSGETQMCNNTVKDQQLNGKVDPETDRSNYYDQEGANKVLACLLHFPEQYRAQYTDVTRVYKRLTQEEAAAHGWTPQYQKGHKVFTPEGWTSTFLAAVRAGVIDPNAYVSSTVDYGAKDAFYGTDMIWPSQSQMSTGFAIAQAGYKWSGQPLDADQYQKGAKYEDTNNSIDRRGLYQFIIALANADIDIKFESGLWYTIALPFDMSPAQIRKVFGPDTQVCRFSKVTRITEGEDKQIKLEFRNSVMDDFTSQEDASGNIYNGTSYKADHLSAAGTHFGIRHHYPYMIRPAGDTDEQYTTHEYVGGKKIWHFKGLDFPRESGILEPDVLSDSEHGTPEEKANAQYSFSPILSTAKIKTYSYILAEDKTSKKHKYFFYKGVKKLDADDNPVIANNDSFVDDGDYVYEPGGSANQNTAYVMCNITGETVDGTHVTWKDWGYEDYKIFFRDIDPNKPTSSPSAGAKVFSFFGDEEDDAPTAIEKVVIVCGQDGIEDNIVYTINGVRVNGDYLPAGLYIKNGKKFIVK